MSLLKIRSECEPTWGVAQAQRKSALGPCCCSSRRLELDAGAAVLTTRPLAALAELVLPGWGARIVSDGDPPFFGQDWPFLGPPS